MIFALSKIFWTLANPGNLILVGLLVGFMANLAPWRRLRRLGRWVLGLTIGIAAVLAVLPVGTWMLRPLEERFPPMVELPARVDGIVVLGGAIDLHRSADRPGIAVGGSAERITEFVGLAQQLPDAKLVFTGGSGYLLDQVNREADYAQPLLKSLGVDPVRVLFDREARNTHENAKNALALAQPMPGEVWLLVTSAYHMPRAIGAFRQAGWAITAYPVDYRTASREGWEPDFNLTGGLGMTAIAVKEWIGLLAYRIFGWSNTVFPRTALPDASSSAPSG